MAIPELICVSRTGGNYSSCIGFHDLDSGDNQFWGRVVAAFTPTPKVPGEGWRPHKRWYAVLHKFDGWGRHIGTAHWFAGTSANGEREVVARASSRLDEMVAGLGPVEFDDIQIRLFQVEIDGIRFGMIDVSEPEAGPEFADRVAMEPGNLLFHAPWDGGYCT
jgi:formate hydrogenlyase regulatory protein HycA